MLFEYNVDDWVGRRDGKSVYPKTISPVSVSIWKQHTDNRHVFKLRQFARNSCFAVPTCFRGKIDDDRSGFHGSNHLEW